MVIIYEILLDEKGFVDVKRVQHAKLVMPETELKMRSDLNGKDSL